LREGAGVDVEPAPGRGMGSASTTVSGVPAVGATHAGGAGDWVEYLAGFLLLTLHPSHIRHTIPAQQL
jgi:hypothetical protein